MAAPGTYTPDKDFYARQIKALEKSRKKFTDASYDSGRRAYIVDGRELTKAQLDAEVSKIDSELSKVRADEKKYGRYGPAYGPAAQGNAAGDQFLELYNTAKSIEVTDFDSALQSLQAWRAVDAFLAENPDTRVVVQREALVVGERGRTVRKSIEVSVDPTKDSKFRAELEPTVKNAYAKATTMAETGTTESRTVIKGRGAAATRSKQKVVTNPAELERRLKVLDETVAGPAVAPTTTTVAPSPTTTAPATTTTVPAAGKQTTTTTTVAPSTTTAQRVTGPASQMGQSARMFEEATADAEITKVKRKPKPAPAPETPAAGGGAGGGGGTGRGTMPAAPTMSTDRVMAKFRELFPAQAWITEIDPAKYPDVQKLLRKAVAPGGNYTAERFAAEWKNTSFYREAASKGIVRQVVQAVGDLGFESKPLNAFVTQAMNMGWDGDTLRFEAYREAFRKDNNGAFVNPQAVERVKKSNDYLQVANIGKAFFNQVSDNTVERVLMGEMSQDDVARQQRELAKSRYGHLAPLIDQGLTLQEIGDNYRSQAAQLLEKDPNSIDMSQADYEVALNFGEPGQKRLMTQGEWQRLLRSDAKYGWEKTNNAKQEARKLSDSIVAAFGRVI